MSAIVVKPPRITLTAEASTLSADIHIGDTSTTMWFRFPPGFPLLETADPFVLSMRMTSMRLGLPLRSVAPVSSRLLESLPLVSTIFHAWYPELSITPVEAAAGSPPPGEQRLTATCFSMGLDSFYSAVRNLDRISILVLVHGFDFSLSNHEYRTKASTAATDAARMLGKELVEVETNSREITEPYTAWGYHQHGAALAAVAAAMVSRIDRMLIPATATYRKLSAFGSHPMTDPLWSTDLVTIEHDGIEASRTQKAAFLAGNAAAMKHLRVCWRNPDNAYNCGKCEKCVRTMISLLTAGALDKCTSFPTRLTPELIDAIQLPSDIAHHLLSVNFDEVKAAGTFPEIEAAIGRCLNRHAAGMLGRQLRQMPPLPDDIPELGNAVFQHRDSLLRMMAAKGPVILLTDAARAALRSIRRRGS